MTLEDQLLQQLVDTYRVKGKNLQGVLDNPLFKDLPLDQKVKFINNYKDQLKSDPKFNWSSLGEGAVFGGLNAVAGVRMGQLISGGSNPKALITAGILGSIVGGGLQGYWSKKEYNHDVNTQKSIDDAIKTLIQRSNSPKIGRTDYLQKAFTHLEGVPEKAAPVIADAHNRFYGN